MNLKEKLKTYNVVIREITPARIYYDIDLESIEDNNFDTDSYSTNEYTKHVKPLEEPIEYEIEIDGFPITEEPVSQGELTKILNNINEYIEEYLYNKYKTYQLKWMMDRNLGIYELFDAIGQEADDLFENGFDGEIFATFDEWIKNDSGLPDPFKA